MKYIFRYQIIIICLLPILSSAQFKINYIDEGASKDLVLFNKPFGNETFLVNKCGEIINKWEHENKSGLHAELTKEGYLLRTGYPDDGCCSQASSGGIIEMLDWDNNTVWEYKAYSDSTQQHHDFFRRENGNILYIGWQALSESERIMLGDTLGSPSGLWSEFVKEIKPIFPDSAEIIWEWHLKDHLIQDHNPNLENYASIKSNLGKVNINYNGPSSFTELHRWHANSIDFNPETNEILIGARSSNELWIIDRSTTIVEAATNSGGNSGLGGQLLFRWGNPAASNNPIEEKFQLFGAHGFKWVESNDGINQIIFFNNGWGRAIQVSDEYSTVETIQPERDQMDKYKLDTDSTYLLKSHLVIYGEDQNSEPLFSRTLSNAISTPIGYLINEGGTGRVFEINSSNDIVWELEVISTNFDWDIFKAHSYSLDFQGFEEVDITPINSDNLAIEFEPCNSTSTFNPTKEKRQIITEIKNNEGITFLKVKEECSLSIYTIHGKKIISVKLQKGENYIKTNNLLKGIHVYKIETKDSMESHMIIN